MTKVTGLQKSDVDQPKCFEHYVKREWIVTCGCDAQSAALRLVIKQSCGVGKVLQVRNLSLTLAWV